MAYKTGTATDYLDLLDVLRRFAAGFGTAAAPVAGGSNVGNGTVTAVDTTAATVTETWTLTCTVEDPDGGTFSVEGSVSGAQASATVGTPYSNAFIAFTINDGAVDYALGDSFTIATTISTLASIGEAWAVERWTGGNELILNGPGRSGAEAVYVGIKAYEDIVDDYFNWELRGYQGYIDIDNFDSQPNTSRAAYLPLWNSSIPYWLSVNGDRIVMVAKISTVYELLHLGRVLPYGTPDQIPYPVVIAGGTGVSATRWSGTDTPHSNLTYASGGSNDQSSSLFCGVDNAWYAIRTGISSGGVGFVTPYIFNAANTTQSKLDFIDVNPDGSYTLEPLRLIQVDPQPNTIGEFDGIAFVTGQDNAAENIITVDSVDWLVVPNIYKSSRADYCAVKLA